MFKHVSPGSRSPAVPDMLRLYSIFNKSADKMCRCMIDERFPSCIKHILQQKNVSHSGECGPQTN